MTLALLASLPFLGALLSGPAARAGRGGPALCAGAATVLGLLLLGQMAPPVLHGASVISQTDWLPELGLSLSFRLDGLGLLFAILIFGIGSLVIVYAHFYLTASEPKGRFFASLMLFQGAMLGIVLSDNILLLLFFWELTALASFLLIGFWSERPDSRRGARTALVVTGAGGLALLAGLLILGQIAGSYELTVILTRGAQIRASDLYLPALILILIGAFAKSAQFPFHFWLPQAMAAPTPVSAYLHSATMVKAGIYLLARLWPVLSGSTEWFVIVTTTGLATMILGAVCALFRHDIKALLAYSTVSQLGLITMLLGIGSKAAVSVAMFHILNHAIFKAALFLTAGIVEHAAHTRDIRRLGGLRHMLPLTFAATLVAALSMAGVPPLNGFLSKEMLIAEVVQTPFGGTTWLFPTLVVFGAALSAAYSFRLLAQVFFGPPPARDAALCDPAPGLWLPPMVLAVLVVVIGLLPMTVAGWLVDASAAAATGTPMAAKIALWHGIGSPALWLSLLALGAGLGLWLRFPGLMLLWERMPRPDAGRLFDTVVRGAAGASHRVTERLHDGALSRYLALALVAIVTVAIFTFFGGVHAAGTRLPLPADALVVAGGLIMGAACGALVLRHRDRLFALMLTAVIGLILAGGFAYFSAPDLALTQISVEVVTVMLMILALNFLPQATPRESRVLRRARDGAIAVAAGLGAGALSYTLMLRTAAFEVISGYHLENAKALGGGNNVVNVILVDFRGYDTFGEIVVLGIAALIIFALTEVLLAPGAASVRLRAMRPVTGDAGDRHPLLFVVVTRILLPLALIVGVFIFLRGHNLPGGGFVAGLIVGIALLLQYMASGLEWSVARRGVQDHALIGWGMLVAGLTGAGAWAFGAPFLASSFGYVTLWPLEKFEVATAALFDLGVFLTVLGAVMLTLGSLSRLAKRSGETASLRAFDAPLREAR